MNRIQEIVAELDRATDKFPTMRSPHEGLAILHEEYMELQAAVYWGTPEEVRDA